MTFDPEYNNFHSRKCTWKCRMWNDTHYVPVPMCWRFRIRFRWWRDAIQNIPMRLYEISRHVYNKNDKRKYHITIASMIIQSIVQNRGVFCENTSLIARFMGPTWGPSGADRTQVGPMLAPWTTLSGISCLCWRSVDHDDPCALEALSLA